MCLTCSIERNTYGCEENDGQEVSDRLDVSHDLLCDHVPLRRDQCSSQEAAELHRDVQQLCDLRIRDSASLRNTCTAQSAHCQRLLTA